MNEYEYLPVLEKVKIEEEKTNQEKIEELYIRIAGAIDELKKKPRKTA